MELLGGRHAELFGSHNLIYAVYYTIEETAEMFGIALFIYSLLTYISQQFEDFSLVISNNKAI